MATDPENTPTTSKKPAAPKASASDQTSKAKGAAASTKITKKGKSSDGDRRKPVRLDSPRWLVPVMVASFIIGLVWIVAYYVAPDAPVISDIGWWNVLIGFGFFTVGFFLSTKWK
jgi:hypothetical protein